jgi:hypothetical protein
MLGVVAHYVNHSGEAKDCLLGLKRLLGAHSGENIVQPIIAITCIHGATAHVAQNQRFGRKIVEIYKENVMKRISGL